MSKLKEQQMVLFDADGQLTESAKVLLKIIKIPLSSDEISKKLGKPLKSIKNSLYELSNTGLIAAYKELYVITDKGKDILCTIANKL